MFFTSMGLICSVSQCCTHTEQSVNLKGTSVKSMSNMGNSQNDCESWGSRKSRINDPPIYLPKSIHMKYSKPHANLRSIDSKKRSPRPLEIFLIYGSGPHSSSYRTLYHLQTKAVPEDHC